MVNAMGKIYTQEGNERMKQSKKYGCLIMHMIKYSREKESIDGECNG